MPIQGLRLCQQCAFELLESQSHGDGFSGQFDYMGKVFASSTLMESSCGLCTGAVPYPKRAAVGDASALIVPSARVYRHALKGLRTKDQGLNPG